MADAYPLIKVEVVYAQAQCAVVAKLALARGSNVDDALRVIGQDPRFKAVDLTQAALGIYGVSVAREQTLNDGDRIEIYRPLAQDPKSARRHRARQGERH